jgi:hypothetical protein
MGVQVVKILNVPDTILKKDIQINNFYRGAQKIGKITERTPL